MDASLQLPNRQSVAVVGEEGFGMKQERSRPGLSSEHGGDEGSGGEEKRCSVSHVLFASAYVPLLSEGGVVLVCFQQS